MSQRPTVVVIGAGFSGLLTALHLVADPQGPTVRLIERARAFGRGAAYSTGNPDHLLNVRVANMSAYPDDPEHFTRWLATHEGWSSHGGFVTRGVYGDYLQDLLREALENTAAGRLLLEQDEAVDVKRAGENARVLIEDRKVVALFMSRGTPHTQAILPWLDKHGVALIGPSTGAMVLHKPVQKHVFNIRSTYQRESEKAVQHLHTVGIDRIAVVHAADSFGKDGLEGANNGFAKAKIQPVAVIPDMLSKNESV